MSPKIRNDAGTSPKLHVDLEKFRHGTSTVASVSHTKSLSIHLSVHHDGRDAARGLMLMLRSIGLVNSYLPEIN